MNPYKPLITKYSGHTTIIRRIGKNNKVLDVGCNDGYLGINADKTNQFYGLDFSAICVNNAKLSGYIEAIQYDLNLLQELPWKKKFDVIIFADVLEHVLYPKKVIEFFTQNYLAENGHIIFSLPNVANWQIRANLLFGKFKYTETGILDKTHLHLYTYFSATDLVCSANLNIEHIESGARFFGYILAWIPALRGLLATNIIITSVKKNNI